GFIIFLVCCGFGLAQTSKNINDIWDWLMMGLTAGFLLPNMFKFLWWRFNAGGLIIGSVMGIGAACIQRWLMPDMDPISKFTILSAISLVGIVIGTFLTPPTNDKTLDHFYKTTRPFGLWGPYKKRLDPEFRKTVSREHIYDILTVPLAMSWLVSMLLLPMQLLIRSYTSFWITLVIFILSLIGLYFVWYQNLPPDQEGVTNPGVTGPLLSRTQNHRETESDS
ncbi:MAG: hypothetical protein JSV03_17725, partial [Planctomycetota bacterium]